MMACGISHRTHQQLSHTLLQVISPQDDCCLSHVSLPFPSLLTTDGSMSKPRAVALKFQLTPECPGFLVCLTHFIDNLTDSYPLQGFAF